MWKQRLLLLLGVTTIKRRAFRPLSQRFVVSKVLRHPRSAAVVGSDSLYSYPFKLQRLLTDGRQEEFHFSRNSHARKNVVVESSRANDTRSKRTERSVRNHITPCVSREMELGQVNAGMQTTIQSNQSGQDSS